MAVKKGVKKRDYENLTPENIEKVIQLLGATPPISKKEACEILNIAYNTTRLSKIISEHNETIAEEARRRAANRGKPFDDYDKQMIISAVFDGDSVAELSKTLYRSTSSINRIIAELGIPQRSESYFEPAMLPEKCVSESFEVGQIVWSAKKDKIAVICPLWFRQKTADGLEHSYCLYEFERIEKLADKDGKEAKYFRNCNVGDYGGRYANYRASEIGSLEHLKQYGIDLYKTYGPHFPLAVRTAMGLET